jgi:hypothetical protein
LILPRPCIPRLFYELVRMEAFGVNRVMDSPPPEYETNKQVEVDFEEVEDAKLLQLQDASFLVYHYIDDIGPSS